MSNAEKQLVEAYSGLLEGLSSTTKIGLIEKLSKSLKKEKKAKDETFYKSFGAFGSKKSAEEIIKDIKSSRKFINKEIKF